MTTSKTKFVILGLLSEQSLTGYEIRKIIDIRFSFFWNESYGQIYPSLKKLLADELITIGKNNEPSKRERISYSITEKGKTQLIDWLALPVEKESVRFEILLKIYFSKESPQKAMLSHLEAFKNSHQKQLSMLNLFESELLKIKDQDNHEEILKVISFGQKVYAAYLEWCSETEKFFIEKENNQ